MKKEYTFSVIIRPKNIPKGFMVWMRPICMFIFFYLYSIPSVANGEIGECHYLRADYNVGSEVVKTVIEPHGKPYKVSKRSKWRRFHVKGYRYSRASKYALRRRYAKAARHSANISRGSVSYYTNVEGYRVQSPTYYNNTPSGATAICRDGTYSFSRNRCGTCSGHGGVARWLK